MIFSEKRAIQNIRKDLEDYITRYNIRSLVLGISGGIDSAVCAALARPVCDKLEIPLIGRSIPIYTNKSDEIERARLVGMAFCHDFEEVLDLHEPYNQLWSKVIKTKNRQAPYDLTKEKIRAGNVKARLRMIYLYDVAQLNNGMVLSTDNLTEYLLGFWTLHGDVGDFGMVQNIYKTEVYSIAEFLEKEEFSEDESHALMECVNAKATDGLGITDSDLEQILPEWRGDSRSGYKEVDRILQLWRSADPSAKLFQEHPVIVRHIRTKFKRENPYNIPMDIVLFGK